MAGDKMEIKVEPTKEEIMKGIEEYIERLEVLRKEQTSNSVLLGVEAQVANAINYSEYKKYITPEEANKYRTQVLNS